MTPIPVETVENKVDELEENGKAMKRKEATEVDESSVKAESDAGDEDHDENGKQVQPNRGQRRPIVLERFVKGYVKWFSMSRGYGFIHIDDRDEEVFVHASSIVRSVNLPLVLVEGQRVEFDIIEGQKGAEAACVSGPDGMRVGRVLATGPGRIPMPMRYYNTMTSPRYGPGPRRQRISHSQEEHQDGGEKQAKPKMVDKEVNTNKVGGGQAEKADADKEQPKKQAASKKKFNRRNRNRQQAKDKKSNEEEGRQHQAQAEEDKQKESDGDKENEKPKPTTEEKAADADEKQQPKDGGKVGETGKN